MMYRMSYGDLRWESVFLDPVRFTLKDGIQTPLSEGHTRDLVTVDPERRAACLGMPAGRGKITDSGYDQMTCLVTEIPVYDHVLLHAGIRVLEYPAKEEQNGQEGLGLFFRDTMKPDPITGYPYSNMAAVGFFRGKLCLFGREGVGPDSTERLRNTLCEEPSAHPASFVGRRLELVLEKRSSRLSAVITAEGSSEVLRFETAVEEDAFSLRDRNKMTVGFLAARGCRMEVDLDSTYIEFTDGTGSGTEPVLYASFEGGPTGQGTLTDPLSLQAAVDLCRCGQEIRVMPGRYDMTGDLIFSGRGGGRSFRTVRAETSSGEAVILDFGGEEHGVRVTGNGWDIRGLIVARGLGFMIQGKNNRLRDCTAIANRETGFLIRHPDNDAPKEEWPAGNELSNCVSCLNRDLSGQNADGFACKVAAGPDNRFFRCTAWMNSDDGFDLFSKNRAIGAVRISECRSWLNGYMPGRSGLVRTAGNGNGFKLGGSGLAVDHEADGCEAIGNRGCGFTSNSNPHMRLSNCRSGSNRENFVFYYTGQQAQPVRHLENCTECDAPTFDPASWAAEHILPAFGQNAITCAEDVLELIQAEGLEGSNRRAEQNGLRTLEALYAVDSGDRPAIMILCSSLYGGGAERVACHLANGLSKHWQVYMLFIQDKETTYPLDPGVVTVRMPGFRGPWQAVMDHRIGFARQMKQILKIHTAISFMFTMNKINVLSKGSETVICSERNNPAKRDPEHMPEIEGLYEAADHVVFQSKTVRDLFSRKVRNHSSIILNPVEVACKKRVSTHRIVNVGRLVPQKNQALLIRAFASFYRKHRDYTLSFYGTGELADPLIGLARSLGLEEAVQFHGQIQEIHPAIADAEIFVLSSNYEGLSNALLESMMMGLACVSTRCEGSSEVICSGENGWLVDVESEEQLTAAMMRLAEDPGLRERLGSKARETAEAFNAGSVLMQWENLIDRLEKSTPQHNALR